MRRIAIYDLDRTVTHWPTYSPFLIGAAARIAPWRLLLLPVMVMVMAAHALRLFGRDRLKTVMWALMLGRTRPEALGRTIDGFVAKTLARNIRPGARARIARDKGQGAQLVLATAAHELYAAPIATTLGFDLVIGTRARIAPDGRVGPGLDGANVYGGSKLAAIERFLAIDPARRAATVIAFYSDSSSDRPVFEWADEPMAVNPSRRLRRLATLRGWPIEDWGRPGD